MKYFFYGLMVIGAFFFGKMMYGPLAPSLLGTNEENEDSASVVEIKVKSPAGTITETIDYRKVDPKDFPESVVLASSLVLTDKNGLSPLILDAGSPVTPLELDAELKLKVTSALAAHLTGSIPVVETDFAEGVAKKRMERRMAAVTPPATQQDTTVAANSQGQKGPAMGGGAPQAQQEVAAQESAEETAAVAANEEPAEAEPEPEPAPAEPTTLDAEGIVAAMKASLADGSIVELDAAKVTNWEAGEDESFDGVDYQVGIATYNEMTILGEKTLQAKALFKEGKLAKWIHAKTGMEIR
ncbi:hypothetical protein [Roseibacillus ishigakijimensis]|uniref:Uncharacterized protein n=1 Tax=Roseibacillus ishigakijimensis TaxID=454146 RepID=A0A934RL84_9BACT|nr:hypothetical protein [Roseibacillus ishigakijimensis]MBK1832810.1 hypothetical protein [Roseibacillus ishigakijimensis]